MELLEFFEKYIPEFETRFQTWKAEVKEEWGCHELPLLYYDFFKGSFPEAMRNYTNKICEKQRENCAKKIYDIHIPKREQDVLNAEQPKIEEL